MLTRRSLIQGLSVLGGAGGFAVLTRVPAVAATSSETFEIVRTEEEWKRLLTQDEYWILRDHGTERPGSSPLNDEHRKGTFACAGCDLPLFRSETKYDSGTGWPSFHTPIEGAVGTREDRTLFFMVRTEVHCARCGGHLGHVFGDGPPPTGQRYCINGIALDFQPD